MYYDDDFLEKISLKILQELRLCLVWGTSKKERKLVENEWKV